MILAFDCSADDLLSDDQMDAFSSLGGQLLSLGPQGRDVKTLDGAYEDWMAAADAHYAIIRPDFYVAATAHTPAQLASCFDTILSRLGVFS